MPELRKIDAAGFKAAPRIDEFGPAPQLQWLPIADLRVDDSYQRLPTHSKSRENIARIAAGFDWRKFAPVVVSPIAGGLFAVVDGQHRAIAALLCGHETLPCAVIHADRREQAEAFRAINGAVTKVAPYHLWRARMAANEAVALRTADVCKRAGVRIRFQVAANEMQPGDTLALAAIEDCVARYGDVVTQTTLAAIVASAGPCTGHLRAGIIVALGAVFADHPEWRASAALFRAMEEIDLLEAMKAAASQAHRSGGVSPTLHLQAAIVDNLHARLDARRLPLPAERPHA